MTNTSQNIYITYRINSGKVLCFYLSCFRVFVVRNVQLQAGTVNNHPPAAPFSNERAPCIETTINANCMQAQPAEHSRRQATCARTKLSSSHETDNANCVQLHAAERSRRQATCARTRLSSLHETDNANRVQLQAGQPAYTSISAHFPLRKRVPLRIHLMHWSINSEIHAPTSPQPTG